METFLTWGAPALTILAALMTASNLGTRITGWGFVVFTVGSLAWLGLGLVTGQPALLWQNVVLTALNLFGVWRWLGRQRRLEDGATTAHVRSRRRPEETLFPVTLLTRAAVTDRTGETLGTSVDAMAGCASGTLRYLVVSSGGVAGVGEQLRRLDWGDARVEGEEIRFTGTADKFAALPDIRPGAWPAR